MLPDVLDALSSKHLNFDLKPYNFTEPEVCSSHHNNVLKGL